MHIRNTTLVLSHMVCSNAMYNVKTCFTSCEKLKHVRVVSADEFIKIVLSNLLD